MREAIGRQLRTVPEWLLRKGIRWEGEMRWGRERGTTTAEYAIVTMAAVAFGSTLVAILRSGAVRGLLVGLVQRALSVV